MTIAPGDYEGQAIEGTVQIGESNNGSLQMFIDMRVFSAQGEPLGEMTTFLFFTEKTTLYSLDRLRLLGWQGQGVEDVQKDKIGNIYSKKVPVRISAPEQYRDPKDGAMKMGQSKIEILLAGAGRVVMSKPLDWSTFQARLKAIGGSSGGSGSAAPTGGGGTAPPF